MLKLICEAKLPFDYEELGFIETDMEVVYWQSGTKRIIIQKRNNRVQFNCVTMEVLMKFSELVKRGLIEFSYGFKREYVTISRKEYEDLLYFKREYNMQENEDFEKYIGDNKED